uniref:Uncharacterized protein AlNc14C34G3085 n=1 Tax=Albugo laibachii Nc14 TaxID=890382 RepID=F0W8F5_9STRA|nr:conserved hypothetical protein [Albugo laibachii Nc14]|eukprot:CCA17410.1 conserved hypothetical protein [Albugo laibachii Nc14]
MSTSCDRFTNTEKENASNELKIHQSKSLPSVLGTPNYNRNALIAKGNQLLALYQACRNEGQLAQVRRKSVSYQKSSHPSVGTVTHETEINPSYFSDSQPREKNATELYAHYQDIWNAIGRLQCPQIETALINLKSVIDEYSERPDNETTYSKTTLLTSERANSVNDLTGFQLKLDMEMENANDAVTHSQLARHDPSKYENESLIEYTGHSIKVDHMDSVTSCETNEKMDEQVEGCSYDDKLLPSSEDKRLEGYDIENKERHDLLLVADNRERLDYAESIEMCDPKTLSIRDESHSAQDLDLGVTQQDTEPKDFVSLCAPQSENPTMPVSMECAPRLPIHPPSKNDVSMCNVIFTDRGPIGIHFQANFPDNGATVRELLPEMAAQKLGQVEPFDRLIAVNNNSVETAPFRHIMLLLEGGLRPLTLTFARANSGKANVSSELHDIAADGSILQKNITPQEHDLDEEIVLDAESEEENEIRSENIGIDGSGSNISIADKIITNVFSFFWTPPLREDNRVSNDAHTI